MGWRAYSLASARRTSFLTICWLLLSPSWVLPSIVVSLSTLLSIEDASDADGERRRRVGGGEPVGEASACCLGRC